MKNVIVFLLVGYFSTGCTMMVQTCYTKARRGPSTCPMNHELKQHLRSLSERGHCGKKICIDGAYICEYTDDEVTCY